MFKRFLTLIPISLAALALAQNASVVGAKGEGAATSEDGRHGRFNFQMVKHTRPNGEFRIEGRLRFESLSPAENGHPARHVVIEMGNARVLDKANNVVEFAGPGVIVVKSRGETVRHEGRVEVRVEDRRRQTDRRGRPDLFRIGFNFANSDRHYRFGGEVQRGDIEVFQRPA